MTWNFDHISILWRTAHEQVEPLKSDCFFVDRPLRILHE